MLDHLLHDAFSDDAQTGTESDLVLDPDPPQERIAEVLCAHRFRDVKQAYRNLMALGEEKIRFLSTRRCRHFLAAIAPQLLAALAATADPDAALVNLDKVSESLGGKGVLWELFSFNPPSLRLYVELCAYSPYLSGILTSNPGMLDGLMDSLVLDKLPSREALGQMLAELCRGAEDIDPILHSFKNDQQLCVGVRDLLGKEDVQAATGALSDIAETCLTQIAAVEYERLAAKLGRPRIGDGPRRGKPCEMVVLAMGKFGGREMNYHSDLDIVFLFEADGQTAIEHGSIGAQGTSNQHFFSELGQRIIKTASRLAPAAGYMKWMPGSAPPAAAGHWPSPCRSLSVISPPARGNFGSGRRCARRGRCAGRRGRCERPPPPPTTPHSAAAGDVATPLKSTTCADGWKRLPWPAT